VFPFLISCLANIKSDGSSISNINGVWSRRLTREEAIFAGTSTGANLVAALRVAKRLGTGATVVTLACDHGLKYISTDLYR
jgi:cysteine synthase